MACFGRDVLYTNDDEFFVLQFTHDTKKYWSRRLVIIDLICMSLLPSAWAENIIAHDFRLLQFVMSFDVCIP